MAKAANLWQTFIGAGAGCQLMISAFLWVLNVTLRACICFVATANLF